MEVSRATLRAAHAIALDAALAEVGLALHERGIRPLLIKGPAVARWLYDDPGERPYGDLDLLVDPEQFAAAGVVLGELGFHDTGAGLVGGECQENASTWLRVGERPIFLDLHRSLFLMPAQPAVAWRRLSADAHQLAAVGVPIDTPAPPEHLVILALHAAQHGAEQPKPLADLGRAVVRVDPATWRAAGAAATELGAGSAMREGLKLVTGGGQLADQLGLADDASRTARLHARTAPATAPGIERLIATRGVGPRLRLIARELVPSVAFMRVWQPLAARGPAGLGLAYLWRPLWLAAKLPGGARAWCAAAIEPGRAARLLPFLAGGCWALRAWCLCRWQLRRRGLPAVRLPAPPRDRPGAGNGVYRVLGRAPTSCLERSLIRQRWHARHGRPRDVVIGLRGPAAEFGAHAWLDGDPPDPAGFEELLRWPPPDAAS